MMFQNCNKNGAKNATKMKHVDGRPILLQKGQKKVTKNEHVDGRSKFVTKAHHLCINIVTKVEHAYCCSEIVTIMVQNSNKIGTRRWVFQNCNKNGAKIVTKVEHRNIFTNIHF